MRCVHLRNDYSCFRKWSFRNQLLVVWSRADPYCLRINTLKPNITRHLWTVLWSGSFANLVIDCVNIVVVCMKMYKFIDFEIWSASSVILFFERKATAQTCNQLCNKFCLFPYRKRFSPYYRTSFDGVWLCTAGTSQGLFQLDSTEEFSRFRLTVKVNCKIVCKG